MNQARDSFKTKSQGALGALQTSAILLHWFEGQSDTFSALADRFLLNKDSIEVHVDNCPNPALKTLIVSGLLRRYQRPLVMVCPDPQAAMKYYRDFIQLLDRDQVVLYPSEDISPYDLANLSVKTIKEQYHFAKMLHQGLPKVYLIPSKSLVLKHLGSQALDDRSVSLTVDQALSPQSLAEVCQALGYSQTSVILEPGEYSSRGDIFDLYPVQGDPVRVEFFGDSVETIRRIDIETQRSVDSVKTATLIARHALSLDLTTKRQLIEQLDVHLSRQNKLLQAVEAEALSSTVNNQIQALDQQFIPDGIDYYAPLVQQGFETILEAFAPDTMVVVDDWSLMVNYLEGYTDRLSRQLEDGIIKGRLLDIGFPFHLSASEGLGLLKSKARHWLYLDTLPLDADQQQTYEGDHSRFEFELQGAPAFKADMKAAVAQIDSFRSQGYRVVMTTDSPQRVIDNCKEGLVPAHYLADETLNLVQLESIGPDPVVTKNGLLEGFVLPEAKLVHLTDTELFGRRQKKVVMTKTSASKRQDFETIKAIDELREGDYVVHVKHGIGRFMKIAQIAIGGERREYLTIIYANHDKLHVPADQINMLSRYRGAGDVPPKLNKMGGIDWGKTKSKVEKSVRSIARELLRLYSVRARTRGYTFEPDSPWQVELEEAFPYVETPDQWQAIVDVKTDMESEKPMDRLICGDVGFGKTEVAIRAIFKSILSGKQVAVLVPTTILAQQHFNTISERFKPYPVKVGLLSRFRSPKEQKEVVNRLALGECDVVIGTHRLLQKDIRFKNLGLVIIDEEHRFGVSHKEKLKELRCEVDALTLSATPIPRTLYMSLSGVRDMSLINTPPVNRSPIKTFVGPYNPAQVRMAILQEVDRGGQVYFLHNRVQTIYAKVNELEQLVPEVRFGVGHGQMNERDLENVMLDFAQQTFDVLVCTTIIESGLDIPTANTMIIDRSDRFGLAQLYQIRGRVGRSDVQAYCYCYYDQERILTQDAQQRLRAIREFTSLGSGYQIAQRDLEIRGVGNILGSEQHGHMVSVGFDLYCDLLQQSIDELHGKVEAAKEDSIIDLNVTAFIPDEWVGDKNVKLTEYKRLGDIRNQRGLDIIEAEWKDRFGDIPEPTRDLMRLVKLRILATDLGIPSVREDEEHLRIAVPYTLQEWIKMQAKMPSELGKKARWVPPVKSKEGSMAVLLIKQGIMKGKDQITLLENLFLQIQQLALQGNSPTA